MTTSSEILAAAMTEQQLQNAIVELGHALGYKCAHFRAGRTVDGWRTPVTYDSQGFFDLVLIGPLGVVFAEVKSETGALGPGQIEWFTHTVKAGARVFTWRPSDWLDGTIERELRRETP